MLDFDLYFWLLVVGFLFIFIIIIFVFYMKKSKAELEYLDRQIDENRRERKRYSSMRDELRRS